MTNAAAARVYRLVLWCSGRGGSWKRIREATTAIVGGVLGCIGGRARSLWRCDLGASRFTSAFSERLPLFRFRFGHYSRQIATEDIQGKLTASRFMFEAPVERRRHGAAAVLHRICQLAEAGCAWYTCRRRGIFFEQRWHFRRRLQPRGFRECLQAYV